MGHLGINNTVGIIEQEYRWYGLTLDIRHFVNNCPACQMQRKRFDVETEMKSIDMEAVPCRQVGIDLQGPNRVSGSGNTYTMVVMDCCTKFMEASTRASTRYSPFYLLFGRAPVLPGAAQSYIQNLTKVLETDEDMEVTAQHLVDMCKDQQYEEHSKAMTNIHAAQARQKKHYDAWHIKNFKQRQAEATGPSAEPNHVCNLGDFVEMKAIGQREGKLTSGRDGPFKVTEISRSGTSVKVAGYDGTEWWRHMMDLTPCGHQHLNPRPQAWDLSG